MDEDDVISEPTENLPQYDPYEPSGRGEKEKPPKNPGGIEAFFVVLILGILPDTIDAIDLGTLSTLTSIISWPATEYYFHQKNLQVPNIKKWIRGLNIGDAIPIIGALPLKTTALVIAIYMAWHPESKVTKAVEAADTATSITEGKKAAVSAKGGFRQKIAQGIGSAGEFFGGEKEEEGGEEENLALGYEKGDEDIYEKMDVGGIRGPEEEAESQTFGEIVSVPPAQQEELQVSGSITVRQKQAVPPPAAMPTETKKQEEAAKIGGAYEQEKEIMKTMESPVDIENILKEKPLPISPPSNPQGIPSSGDEKVVDLRGR